MTYAYSDGLDPCENEIDPASDSLLLRQIAAHIWDDQNAVPTELAFAPQPSDNRRPSLSQDPDPQAARDWHQDNARSASLGVWGVSAQEVGRSQLRAVDDQQCPPEPEQKKAPHHCYLDYRGLTKPQMREARLYLLVASTRRGELSTADKGHHSA